MTTPVLWHFPISHYNEKVRWALDWKGIPHVRRALAMGYLPRALWATGQPRLPILFLDGRAIADSTRIIAAIEEHHPAAPLYPSDPEACRRALAIEDFLDEELGAAVRTALLGPVFARDPAAAIAVLSTGMPRYAGRVMRAGAPVFRAFYRARHAINDATITASRGQVAAALDRLEREIGPAGYLVGDRFTVADLTAAAMLGVLCVPERLEYLPAQPWPPEMNAYRETLAARPVSRWVAQMYERHRGRSAEVPT
jgi:glutathione S-transferase